MVFPLIPAAIAAEEVAAPLITGAVARGVAARAATKVAAREGEKVAGRAVAGRAASKIPFGSPEVHRATWNAVGKVARTHGPDLAGKAGSALARRGVNALATRAGSELTQTHLDLAGQAGSHFATRAFQGLANHDAMRRRGPNQYPALEAGQGLPHYTAVEEHGGRGVVSRIQFSRELQPWSDSSPTLETPAKQKKKKDKAENENVEPSGSFGPGKMGMHYLGL